MHLDERGVVESVLQLLIYAGVVMCCSVKQCGTVCSSVMQSG